jgi:hypothetical protein
VSEEQLRRRFADGDYLNRAERGEFGCCLATTNPSRSPDEPLGTQTVVVSYLDESFNRICMVHFYLRPDGTIAGSGKPDPKWLFEDGVVYVAQKE